MVSLSYLGVVAKRHLATWSVSSSLPAGKWGFKVNWWRVPSPKAPVCPTRALQFLWLSFPMVGWGDWQPLYSCGPGPAGACPLTSFLARCYPGWTLFPVFIASSCVCCPSHDPTVLLHTPEMAHLQLLPWRGHCGSALPLPALGHQFYLSPWPGCGNSFSPTKSQRSGLPWRTTYLPHKTILIGGW